MLPLDDKQAEAEERVFSKHVTLVPLYIVGVLGGSNICQECILDSQSRCTSVAAARIARDIRE